MDARFSVIVLVITAVCLLSACQKSAAEREFLNKVQLTREGHDPNKVKNAIIALIATNKQSQTFDLKQIPTELYQLPIFSEEGSRIELNLLSGSSTNDFAFVFITGSGFGHWGMIVFPFKTDLDALKTVHAKVIPWNNGLFFYIDH